VFPWGRAWELCGNPKAGWPGALSTGHSLLSRLPREGGGGGNCVCHSIFLGISWSILDNKICIHQTQLCACTRHCVHPHIRIVLNPWQHSAHRSIAYSFWLLDTAYSCTYPVGTTDCLRACTFALSITHTLVLTSEQAHTSYTYHTPYHDLMTEENRAKLSHPGFVEHYPQLATQENQGREKAAEPGTMGHRPEGWQYPG
jgi:hypothetical protein